MTFICFTSFNSLIFISYSVFNNFITLFIAVSFYQSIKMIKLNWYHIMSLLNFLANFVNNLMKKRLKKFKNIRNQVLIKKINYIIHWISFIFKYLIEFFENEEKEKSNSYRYYSLFLRKLSKFSISISFLIVFIYF